MIQCFCFLFHKALLFIVVLLTNSIVPYQILELKFMQLLLKANSIEVFYWACHLHWRLIQFNREFLAENYIVWQQYCLWLWLKNKWNRIGKSKYENRKLFMSNINFNQSRRDAHCFVFSYRLFETKSISTWRLNLHRSEVLLEFFIEWITCEFASRKKKNFLMIFRATGILNKRLRQKFAVFSICSLKYAIFRCTNCDVKPVHWIANSRSGD